jgi:tRNA threonylcarbamoyladenosine biosynthesis protein TsaB
MNRLLLETATDVCSVAVAQDGNIIAQRAAKEVHQHASHLTVFIGEALAEAGVAAQDLSEIVLSDGPGSYTSLRVGAATAKGLCLALPHLRLVTVPTLLSLAVAAENSATVLAVINSRRGEVFGQVFPPVITGGQEGVRIPSRHESIALLRGPQNIRLTQEGWWDDLLRATETREFVICGPGQDRLRDYLPEDAAGVRFGSPSHCAAPLLLAPALRRPIDHDAAERESWSTSVPKVVDVAAYEPFYLNPPFVTKSTKKPLL